MKFYKQTIKTVPLENKTVLMRADYNVPLDEEGKISDDFRIRASLPTIEDLLGSNCKVIIMSHMGRPEGEDSKLSLEPVARRLSELLGKPVTFVDKTVGDKVRSVVKNTSNGGVIMLENLRFDAREEANDESFAKQLAEDSGARYFVQDGFGVVHRAHASTEAITHYLPSVAGLLLEKEVSTITNAMEAPKRPLVAVMGGAKISDKIPLVKKFIEVADTIIIGGAMANTFLEYKGFNMASSMREPGQEQILDEIYKAAADKVGEAEADNFLMLPVDVAVASSTSDEEPRRNVALDSLGETDMALDIGDASIEATTQAVAGAGTVIWNGPLGYSTLVNFSHGSARMALALAMQPSTASIIGGGDTADFVLHWDGQKGGSFTHVSTGGGASLELMAGDKLPGVESLLDA